MAMLITSSIDYVSVRCPHCGEKTQVYDLEIACTATGVDIMTLLGEGVNTCECDECGDTFFVTAECDLAVFKTKKEAQ